ncbi:MAG: thioredoxin family protein [Armatimonadota bacterium]
MRPYQVVSLLVVVSGLAFIAGVKVGEQHATPPPDAGLADCACAAGWDSQPPAQRAESAEPAQIPPIAGLPAIVEFGSDECEACRQVEQLLADLAPRLRGRAGVAIVDTDVHPAEAERWRLRIIPTQIFLDAQGNEVARHEGALAAEELLAQLRAAGAEVQ